MPYPQPPWTLKGYAIQTLQLVSIERSHLFIPAEFEIISVWPGKTLGGIYLSTYGAGSALEYHELIVVAGMVKYENKFGAWISHIYVDHPDSLAGGQEIWHLPKQLAEFSWADSSSDRKLITVIQGSNTLCSLSYGKQSFAWRLPLSGIAFSASATNLFYFKAKSEGLFGTVPCELAVPTASPFAQLQFHQPWLTAYCEQLQLTVEAPELIGNREFQYVS